MASAGVAGVRVVMCCACRALPPACRHPEAAFFARTYLPSSISDTLVKWKADLAAINPKVGVVCRNSRCGDATTAAMWAGMHCMA
jgi:hypothetical protein